MGRLHAPELEDQAWFPALFRDLMTDFLAFMGALSERPYRPFVAKLKVALEATASREIVDLGSGGSGPLPILLRTLEESGTTVHGRMTDLHPNVARLERVARESDGRLLAHPAPVDATDVPVELDGFRLMCNAFHHLRPHMARAVLADAVQHGRGIAVLELLERSPAGLASILLAPLNVILLTPLIRPFRLARLLFTYLIPVLPLFVLWDGLMSLLRIYSPDELRALAAQIPDGRAYEWDIGALRTGMPGAPRMVYLIGTPRRDDGSTPAAASGC